MSHCLKEKDLFLSDGWEHRGCHFLEELTLDQDLEKLIDVGMWKRKKRASQEGKKQQEDVGMERIPRAEGWGTTCGRGG